MQVELAFSMEFARSAGKELAGKVAPAGTVLEQSAAFPSPWELVLAGAARPADQECWEKCGLTEEQVEWRIKRYEKIHRGIHPDDYEAYDRGEMVGYDPQTGESIPGPNAEFESDSIIIP